MKKILLLFIFIPVYVFAQKQGQAYIDSTLKELFKLKEDTTLVKAYNNLAFHYKFIDKVSSLKYIDKAMMLSKTLNYNEGISNSYRNYGIYFTLNDDYKNALLNYENALKYTSDKKSISKTLSNIGILYSYQSEYSKELEYDFKALKIAEEMGDKKIIGKDFVIIATCYLGLKDYKNCLYFNSKAISNNNEIKYFDDYNRIYTNNGFAYLELKQYDSAIKNFFKALELDEISNDKYNASYCYEGIGSVYFKKKKYTDALKYFNTAVKVNKEIDNPYNLATNIQRIGSVYLEMAKSEMSKINRNKYLDTAILNFKKSLELTGNDDLDKIAGVNFELYEAQKLKGNYQGALEAFEISELYNDSIYNSENKETIKNLEDKRTIELKEKEIELSTVLLENKEKQKWYLIGGIGLLAIVGALLFYQSRNRKKTNEQLKILNTHLDQANKVKTRFFNILNHDLRSPVSNLIHFMHLQKENPELLDAENKAKLENKTISSAENLLYSMEDILLWSKGQMENFKPLLKDTEVKMLFEDTQKHFASEEKVKMIFENKDNVKINTDENYLKTIMRNLTGNAIKALSKIENGTIIWKVWQADNQKFLSITDNGTGGTNEQFKALYDETEVVGISTGLGLHLIRDLAVAINCKVEVESKINVGTTFILKLS